MQSFKAKGATATDFNRAVYERLKPGVSYLIVDHAAAAGAGTSVLDDLEHRVYALWGARWIKFPAFVERHARAVATYAIGIMATYWFIERLAGFGA